MFEFLIKFSVRHKPIIGFLTLVLIAWGVYSLCNLPFDATPDITSNQVQVITQAPSMSAQEVEQTVTTPLEMALANIPDVIERRSISRSGLSVITLVFKDNTDTYWAREQVSQALKEGEESINREKAIVSLAPISTGLGEIYHYTIRAKEGYEDKYSLTDLRTLQDWVVRKQLAGTEGVAEVSGWGGFVKQYEIAVYPDMLSAYGVTIGDVFSSLAANNTNSGGSYIEKNSNQYFIRGVGNARGIDDLKNTPLASAGGAVLTIGDVADVREGHATRYGAVTRNGEGEVVAGISLMLKGENFQKVVANVKERIDQIRKSLPEGVTIEPFIDRTQLVDRVTDTITRNLLEGGLIVIFILVLFLGNLRAGLVVASVIPLAMLFAFGMMRAFGVSGNLMSLGAIDFGLIVDGAVIIVEAVCHHIYANGKLYGGRLLTQGEMDGEVVYSASRIRKSAAFGEIIIMIVYLPLLSLGGIEGKLFRPMALTIFFAILGAFILSLTYVPMASALFLSKKSWHKPNLSDRLMAWLEKIYRPVLRFSLDRAVPLIIAMLLLFAGSVWVFTRLGGEFIPTLEEGDFAAEVSMAQGTSLSQMVETMTVAEKILKDNFPEVKQVVTRIGSAEIPTDPMPVERADMLIALKPKKEWKSARTASELMEMMEEALSVIPGMEAEMTQPIQMRNNELITGIKQDVAVKIYGEDPEVLASLAEKAAGLIRNVEGVSDPMVEKIQGLPQIQVEFDRERLAAYGLTIEDASRVMETGFAGAKAGTVYEGEKAFDVVVRIAGSEREDIEAVKTLPVPVGNGSSTVTLADIAEISYREAPSQITHDEGERRVFVGFNVRGRDTQSTMEEIEEILARDLKMPAGYYYTYGGQYQNLKEATSRLSVAVPIALLLIIVLLFATLHSLKETLIVFTAVPLSLIGGVMALWMRGMPFSISAGVGFIALFGVSVLNGIVLIGQLNLLEKEGVRSVRERVMRGCCQRLRPVIMTALVASLGFLPMALSHGDGAEVQRPLATVVIGGLITATILTLIVLPSIYELFSKNATDENI